MYVGNSGWVIGPSKVNNSRTHKTFGCSRFVFNYFLAIWRTSFQSSGRSLTYNLRAIQFS
ncbi:helix-turn-helix domain-containing protein [Paenibacillus sp. HB172176]|uniref:helix-turn-helix domain-containing protein n=1 Tax=Paenibacillus sp. HB172176 TaxID=2493690 RepID=UPI0023F93D4B|nr:helix-turn-helix domain-containing protein [Paenibacillus sp. HB172176]